MLSLLPFGGVASSLTALLVDCHDFLPRNGYGPRNVRLEFTFAFHTPASRSHGGF